jgi:hypothetical protein
MHRIIFCARPVFLSFLFRPRDYAMDRRIDGIDGRIDGVERGFIV